MILIRFVLVSLIVYLIIRSFIRVGKRENSSVHMTKPEKKIDSKKVSKEVGEYVDYEDVDK
ncbi:MAG: hypothetical protein WCS03_03550 [Bacteroidota bacterium]